MPTNLDASLTRVLILGAGGHCKVIVDILLNLSGVTDTYSIVGILDDDTTLHNTELMGIPILGEIAKFKDIEHDAVIIAIGDNHIRAHAYQLLADLGEKFITVCHPRSYVAKSSSIGLCTVLIGGSVVNADAKVGNNVIINTNATIGHDAIIEDHVHVAAGVHLGGGVTIKEGAFLGMGVNVLPGKTVGEWSIVGSGSVVTKDVPAGVTVVGVPARVIKQASLSEPLICNRHQYYHQSSVIIPVSYTNSSPDDSEQKNDDVKTVRLKRLSETAGLRIIDTGHEQEWNSILDRCHQIDFYFLSSYNALEEKRMNGKAELWVYQEDDIIIACPLIRRKVPIFRTESDEPKRWNDCSSVYGYSGPISSVSTVPEKIVQNFQREIRNAMNVNSIVTVFARMHPLISQRYLLSNLGSLVKGGRTVSIDLTLSEQEQLSQYRTNHTRDIRRLKKIGAEIFIDESWSNLDTFFHIYSEAMSRVGASWQYLFDIKYLQGLRDMRGTKAHLIFCVIQGELVAGCVFIECNGILEYHLGGTLKQYLKYSPKKMLIDAGRSLGSQRGLSVFHLGGGVGSMEDALYNFKTGFSNQRHEFYTWRWIVDENKYRLLCRNIKEIEASCPTDEMSTGFFPIYRTDANWRTFN